MARYSARALYAAHRRLYEARGATFGRAVDSLFASEARKVAGDVSRGASAPEAVFDMRSRLARRLPALQRAHLHPGALRWAGLVFPMYRALGETASAQSPEDALDEILRAQVAANVDRQIVNTSGVYVSRTVELVSPALLASLEEGLSVDATARALRGSGLNSFRAFRIARTEIIAGMNEASFETLKRTVPGANKQWLSAFDRRRRPTHKAAHGQIVPQNGVFVVGSYRLRWPGDRGLQAGPEEVINCRCALGAVPPQR